MMGGRRVEMIKEQLFIVETRPAPTWATEMTFGRCDCARFVRHSTDKAIVIYHDVDCKELADA